MESAQQPIPERVLLHRKLLEYLLLHWKLSKLITYREAAFYAIDVCQDLEVGLKVGNS